MPQNSVQQGQATPMYPLGPDICYLILEQVCHHCHRASLVAWLILSIQVDNREDLRNLCLVSKEIYHMATTRLHRCIIMGPPDPRPPTRSLFSMERDQRPKTPWDYVHPLLYRLLDENNTDLRNAVREVEIGTFYPSEIQRSIWPDLESMNALPRLVQALPNLKHFR